MFEHTQSKLYYGCRRCIHGDCYLKQERSRKQIRYNYPHNTFVFLFFSNFETMHGSFVQTVICSHICCCFFFKNMINTLYKKDTYQFSLAISLTKPTGASKHYVTTVTTYVCSYNFIPRFKNNEHEHWEKKVSINF